eukprot:717941-Prymnesium_polylepis.2
MVRPAARSEHVGRRRCHAGRADLELEITEVASVRDVVELGRGGDGIRLWHAAECDVKVIVVNQREQPTEPQHVRRAVEQPQRDHRRGRDDDLVEVLGAHRAVGQRMRDQPSPVAILPHGGDGRAQPQPIDGELCVIEQAWVKELHTADGVKD